VAHTVYNRHVLKKLLDLHVRRPMAPPQPMGHVPEHQVCTATSQPKNTFLKKKASPPTININE
jgi:hypothetical protein